MSGWPSFDQPQADFGRAAGPPGYSHEEEAWYQHLLSSLDPSGGRAIPASAAAEFLSRSGLPRPTLHAIWTLADSRNEGALDAQGFYAAMRLVAHAQAGEPMAPGLASLPPPALPRFDGLAPQGSATPSSPASTAGWGTQLSLSTVGGRRPASWSMSQRERRKYASLFIRTDADRDGFVEAEEARSLCERSGLDEADLAVAWAHADQDQDGRLTFPEFVALVHTITCRTRGLPLHPEGPHPELAASVAELHAVSPGELHLQRSRSPSSRGSSMPPTPSSRSVSPAPGRGDAAGDSKPGRRAGFGASRGLSSPRGGDGLLIDTSEDVLTPGGVVAGAPASPPSSPYSPRFGEQSELRPASAGPDLEAVKRHLRAMLEADRLVRRSLEREVDVVEARLQAAREECSRSKPQAARDREESRRLVQMSVHLQHHLADAKQKLAALLDESRTLRAQQKDLERVQETRALMQRTWEEESRLLDETLRTNASLQESVDNLSQELTSFSATREELREQMNREHRLLQEATCRHEELAARAEVSGVRRTPAARDAWSGATATPWGAPRGAWASTLVGGGRGGAGAMSWPMAG